MKERQIPNKKGSKSSSRPKSNVIRTSVKGLVRQTSIRAGNLPSFK